MLELTAMIEDRPGHATQFLPQDPGVVAETVLPTSGIAVGGVQYLHSSTSR